MFVISRVRYIENPDLTNFLGKKNVRYIEVSLMINFQRSPFQDLNNFCNKNFVYEAIVSVQSCTSQLRHQKHKNRLITTVHINFILTGLFRIHLQQSFGHMLTCYILRFVSLLCSLYHTFYCTFGRAEENRLLYRGLRYIEVR